MKNLHLLRVNNRFLILPIVLVSILVAASCTLPIQEPLVEEGATSDVSPSNDGDIEETADTAEATPDESTSSDSAATEEVASENDENTTASTEADASAAVNAPEGTYKGIPVGFTAEGFPYRGSPDAPIVMYEYSDFQCPFCNRYFVQTEPAIDESYVRGGQVRVVFRDFPLVDLHPNAPAAHVASLCAADQGAEPYWEMHARLFQTQSEWNQNSDAAAYFAELAETIGLDMESYQSCIDSGSKDALVAAGVAEARTLGFSGTPSFHFVRNATADTFPLVGAQPYDQFANLLDTLIAGETPQTAQPDPNNGGGNDEIPFWATAEGLSPDPDNLGYTVAGDQYRGDPNAEVVVIEFSDLQCPFCRRHTTQTQPILDEQFVDTGDVLWVFKHFPLSIHPQAPAAGVAAECAANQEKFWEMHEILFANMQTWSVRDPHPIFIELADEIGLDVDSFTTCLDDEEVANRVQSDMNDGVSFVRGTPTFIVLYDGQGSIIPGALPAERFTEILQQVIDGTSS